MRTYHVTIDTTGHKFMNATNINNLRRSLISKVKYTKVKEIWVWHADKTGKLYGKLIFEKDGTVLWTPKGKDPKSTTFYNVNSDGKLGKGWVEYWDARNNRVARREL